jgi:hypothetical protein
MIAKAVEESEPEGIFERNIVPKMLPCQVAIFG